MSGIISYMKSATHLSVIGIYMSEGRGCVAAVLADNAVCKAAKHPG